MSNSEAFLNSYSAIEKHLRSRTGSDRSLSFYQLVERASTSMLEVKRFRVDLKEYADLRNAIVHERSDGHVIAEPNDRAVQDIRSIESLILKPPIVIPLFQQKVQCLEESSSIGKAVSLMHKHSFSQIPITKSGSFHALLTANTVARWLGAQVDDDVFSVDETTIVEVLKYTEDPENHSFLSKGSTLFQVLECFDDFVHRGKRLEAVLITERGKQSEALLGILTVYDLPKVLSKIQLAGGTAT
jgi:predicted transcriptional regulator